MAVALLGGTGRPVVGRVTSASALLFPHVPSTTWQAWQAILLGAFWDLSSGGGQRQRLAKERRVR